MSTSHYYGLTVGVSVVWRGDKVAELKVGSVDRHPPEGAEWTLRWLPLMTVEDRKARKEFAQHLHSLSIAHHSGNMDAQTFMTRIDAAVGLRIDLFNETVRPVRRAA